MIDDELGDIIHRTNLFTHPKMSGGECGMETVKAEILGQHWLR